MNKELQDYYSQVAAEMYDFEVTKALKSSEEAMVGLSEHLKGYGQAVLDGKYSASHVIYLATRKKEWEMANLTEFVQKLRPPLEDYLYDEDLELFDKLVQMASGEHSV